MQFKNFIYNIIVSFLLGLVVIFFSNSKSIAWLTIALSFVIFIVKDAIVYKLEKVMEQERIMSDIILDLFKEDDTPRINEGGKE